MRPRRAALLTPPSPTLAFLENVAKSCICHTSEKSPVTPIIATDPKTRSRKSCVCHTCDPLPPSPIFISFSSSSLATSHSPLPSSLARGCKFAPLFSSSCSMLPPQPFSFHAFAWSPGGGRGQAQKASSPRGKSPRGRDFEHPRIRAAGGFPNREVLAILRRNSPADVRFGFLKDGFCVALKINVNQRRRFSMTHRAGPEAFSVGRPVNRSEPPPFFYLEHALPPAARRDQPDFRFRRRAHFFSHRQRPPVRRKAPIEVLPFRFAGAEQLFFCPALRVECVNHKRIFRVFAVQAFARRQPRALEIVDAGIFQHQLRNASVQRNAHQPQVARLKFPFRLRTCSAVARHIRVLARRRAVPRLRALSLRLGQIQNFRALGVEPKNIRRSLDTGDKLRSRGPDLLAKNVKRAFTIRYIQNGFAVRRPFIRTALAFVHCEALQLANFARPGIHVRYKNGRCDVRANEHGMLSVRGH